MKNSNWDLDLRAGEAGEMKLADLLSMDTIEVKTDRRWHETGNLYIETECFQQSTQTWEDSGISVSSWLSPHPFPPLFTIGDFRLNK